ncbi:MAG: putative toxin-antitoxin system toxin component, PIN family [Bacteroidetes bacterium]|nr:putative toxin-antitoxin system toxin component, PIN family [Bacteroidota bacterium]
MFLKNEYKNLTKWITIEDIVLYCSDIMTTELISVIHRPHIVKFLKLPTYEYIKFYNQATTLFKTTPVFTDCSDPDDNYLFDLAEQSGADYLVTGDKKVLATETKFPLKVITLSKFKQIIYEHF